MPVTKPTGAQAQDRKGPLLPAAHFWGSGSRSRLTPSSPGPGMCPCAHLQGLQPGSGTAGTCRPAGELDLSPSRISPSAPSTPTWETSYLQVSSWAPLPLMRSTSSPDRGRAGPGLGVLVTRVDEINVPWLIRVRQRATAMSTVASSIPEGPPSSGVLGMEAGAGKDGDNDESHCDQ